VETILAHYADNATFQVPTLESPLVGKEAIRTYLTSAFVTFPDWTMDLKEVLVSGHEAVVVNSVHGTHTGPFTAKDGKSVAPTNKKLVQEQLTRVVVNDDGKISLLRSYGNPSAMNRMLRPPQPAVVTTHTETTTNTHTKGESPSTAAK
jgi:ketosteroid isomerase-like protein